MAAYTSRVESAFEQIMTELATITVANGYNTTPTIVRAIRPADAVVVPPEIGCEMGEEEMWPIDTNALVFDSKLNVYIVGTTTAATPVDSDSSELHTATEMLRKDIKLIIASIFVKYAPSSGTLLWNIISKTVTIVPVVGLGERRNKAQVWARFQIHVRNQTSTTL